MLFVVLIIGFAIGWIIGRQCLASKIIKEMEDKFNG